MKYKFLIMALVTATTVGAANAQAGTTVVTGTKKGKCAPEMPMVKAKQPVTIQLKATKDKSFLLHSAELNLHMVAAPGKTATAVVTFPTKGDYGFVCGDVALPENKRTQGMFMAM